MLSLELREDCSEKVHYDYSEFPIYIRRALLSNYPQYRAPSHWHDDVEFIAVLSGEMKYDVNGECICLNRGEGIFVNARQLHYGFSNTRTECDFLCVLFHPIILCSSVAMKQQFVLPLLENSNVPYIKFTQKESWHRLIFQNLEKIYTERSSAVAPVKVYSLFLDIWAELVQHADAVQKSKVPADNNLILLKNMIGFIQKNYQEKLSLADIARSGAVGQSKCCKLFREYLSQTPTAYLTFYRLNKSMELLRHTDMTVSEIALKVGFGGASYFSETFQKWMGLTPTEYKAKHRQK